MASDTPEMSLFVIRLLLFPMVVPAAKNKTPFTLDDVAVAAPLILAY